MYHNFLSGIKSILIFIDLPPGRATIYRAVPCPPGAGRTWGRPRNDIGDAGRRGRRPLPCITSSCRTCRVRDCMVGRDVPGAPRTWRRPRDAHGTTSGTTRGRGPPGTSAPTMYNVLVPNVSRPGLHGRARRPRRAAHMEASTGRTWDDTGTTRGRGPPGTSAPTMCDVPVPNVSRPGLHGRAQVWRARRWGRATDGRRSPRCGRSCRGRRRGDGGRRARASPPPPSRPPP